MKAINKTDFILWLALIGLTLFGYFSSKASLNTSTLILFLLAATAIKFIGVGFQFMELKIGHAFWKIALLLFLLIYSVIVFILT